jgi:sigma-B regulation protein RsbU (phosphoserine phosphatase)
MTMQQAATEQDGTLARALEFQLRARRYALVTTMTEIGEAEDLKRLLREVDDALGRVGTDGFGRCAVCGGRLDDDQLRVQPMQRYCLCRPASERSEALQRDLDLAWQIQAALLPDEQISCAGWEAHYRYVPAGAVSGDYCDVITNTMDDGWVYFLVGDVAGKGIAASYLMAHLSAMVRTALDGTLAVADLVGRLDRYLNEWTPSSHFVTLVCGRADADGQVEVCNAGHCPPLVLRRTGTERLDSSGFPVGIGGDGVYDTHTVRLAPGETLVLYTDGITEARNAADALYGAAALANALHAHRAASPVRLADACLRDVQIFQDGGAPTDDLTLMVLRRTGTGGGALPCQTPPVNRVRE